MNLFRIEFILKWAIAILFPILTILFIESLTLDWHSSEIRLLIDKVQNLFTAVSQLQKIIMLLINFIPFSDNGQSLFSFTSKLDNWVIYHQAIKS